MKYPKPLTVSMMHYKVQLLYRMIHQAMNIYDFWKFHEHAAASAKFQSAAMASVSGHLEQQQGATSSRSFWRSEGQPVTDFSTTPAFVLYLSLLFCNCHSKHFTNRSLLFQPWKWKNHSWTPFLFVCIVFKQNTSLHLFDQKYSIDQ